MVEVNTIQCMDAMEYLQTLPDESVDCVVTSPPYYALRDYGVDGQLGLEDSPQAYIERLLAIFAECQRVLKATGSLWVNIADSYSGSGKCGVKTSGTYDYRNNQNVGYKTVTDLPNKSLCLIPQRLLIGLSDLGYVIRNDIIWNKPSCLPESVRDRFTKSYEHIFFCTKESTGYYFNQDAVKVPAKVDSIKKWSGQQNPQRHKYHEAGNTAMKSSLFAKTVNGTFKQKPFVNRRDVWHINPASYGDAHFATFPEEIPRLAMLSTCPPDGIVLDPFMGAGTTGLVATKLGRKYIGCDLNAEYVEMARKRIAKADLYQDTPINDEWTQKSLWAV